MPATKTSALKLSPKKSQTARSQRSYTEDEVEREITSALSSGSSISATLTRLLSAVEPQRRVVFEACIAALNTGERLRTQVAKDIIGCLLFEVDKLEGEVMVNLAELLIKGVKEGRHHALELFPKLLSVISSQKTIQYRKENGVRGEMGGELQKEHLFNSLCGCRWDVGCVQHIAHMCQEIPMTSDELHFLIEKILRVMKGVKVTELPPLVYQLLVLSVKGHRATVLNGVRSLFNQLDQEVFGANDVEEEDSVMSVRSNKKELLQTEGTVILHITCALKQDPELRKVFTKSLKTSQASLSSGSLSLFNLALVLSLARIHIFEEVVFSFMKEVILRSYKEQERVHASNWMQEVYQDVPSVETLMLDMVAHSANGWDHVVEGLFIVGLQLMETFTPKTASVSSGPQYKACCLGSKILYHTFKDHVMVRQELVTQLINRILTNASTFAGHYTDLLSALVEHYHQAALESLPKLKEAFSSLSFLPPQPALDLLHAVLPLVQFNLSLRDSLLLVLRKSLFSRQMESRKIAVAAYLMLLRKFKVLDVLDVDSQNSLTGSQVMVEVHAGSSRAPTSNGALCLEILEILRRALTKQYDVRLSLYEGLCRVFYSNSKLAEPIMDLLLGQFEQYYELKQDVLPPIKLSACLSLGDGDASLLEPLDVLLQCLQLCVFKYCEWQDKLEEEQDQPLEIPEVIESAKDILASTVERMAKAELEDFELDKSSDFISDSGVGRKNRVLARLVMNTYETLLEYTFTVGEFSQASMEQTLKLFQGYRRIADILQEKAGAQGGGASGKKVGGALGAVKSNLTLQFVVNLLQALFNDSNPNHQQSLKMLRDSVTFPKYVVSAAVLKVHQIRDKGTCDGAFADFRPEKLLKLCCQLSRVLFKQVEAAAGHSSGKKDKGKSIPVLCLEGLSELLQTVVTRYHHKESLVSREPSSTALMSFLAAINPSDESSNLGDKIHHFIRQLQRLVSGVLDANSKEWSLKEVVVMVNMIGVLAGQLEAGSEQLAAVLEWTTSQCKDQNINDIQVTKAFVSLLFTLNTRLKGSVKMLLKFARDVHFHLGDWEEAEVNFSPYFAIVNRHTAPSGVLPLLYSHFELILVDSDWLIARLKTELAAGPAEDLLEREEGGGISQTSRTCFSSLCNRLIIVVNGLNELVQTLLPPGPNTTGVLKLVTKFYTVLGNLTRYCLLSYQQTSYVIPNFKSLVMVVGKELSQQVYVFIAFNQNHPPAGGDGGGGGGGGKSKKGKGKGKGKAPVADSGKTRIRRESRSLPSLIYAIEHFEKLLIQLGKKSKENLMESFKRSLARDFKIDVHAVSSVLNEEEGEEEGEDEEGEIDGRESGEDSGGEESRPPPAKRLRKN